MTNRPLLFFPTPEKADRSKQTGGSTKIHYPSHEQQGKRLAPKFEQLRKSFSDLNADIQKTTSGIDPEQVLVFETIGSVENFANAVKKIEGFEWLGEFDVEEIIPDEDFYAERDKTKNLNGHLYLILSNQRSFNEMLSLWKQYKKNQKMTWDRGLTKFRDVFNYLKDVRHWGIQDRINKKEIEDYLQEELKYGDKNRLISLEIELWYKKDSVKRQKNIESISNLVSELSGVVRDQSVVNEIQYIGILADLPINTIQKIIEHQDIKLVNSDEIKFLHATGQMAVGRQPTEGEPEYTPIEEQPLPHGKQPTIAVFDGLPLTNHELLKGRLIIDDPDNYENEYPAQYRKHGTAMASLITRGDLNESEQPLARPIYIRPIFKPILWESTQPIAQNIEGRETVPKNCLLVDIIHRSVKRLFEGESGVAPVAPDVIIINLSLGDRARPFFQFMSPLARLLDWLSTKYNVLFIVSAGNCSDDITFKCSENEFRALTPSERESESVQFLYNDFRNRRLISPAESINALTIGALHYDTSTIDQMGRRIDILERLLPSPVSAFGSGYRKSVKPDLIFNAGRQLYTHKLNNPATQTTLEIKDTLRTPGIKTACPGKEQGELNGTAYSCGTSNATALISRAAGQCYDTILNIIEDKNVNVESEQVIAILKTMVVHSCSWGNIGERIDNILRITDHSSEKSDFFKSYISRWIGYGVPQIQRMLDCTEQRVTLLGFGQLQNDNADVFHLPLPPSLNGKRIKRRLTVTLSWMSPISSHTQRYRIAQLWFELNNNDIVQKRREVDWKMVRRGTVQHEIFEGELNVPYPEDEVLEIKINCREDSGKIVSPIAYGLAVSLEVADGTNIAIYDEVKTRLEQSVPVQTTGVIR